MPPPHMANQNHLGNERRKKSEKRIKGQTGLAEQRKNKRCIGQGEKNHDGKSGKLVSVILINGCNNLVWKGPV